MTKVRAPRSVWTGMLTVGLVSVPVKLATAIRSERIAFNQVWVNPKTGEVERPRQAYLLANGKEVPKSDGQTYDFQKGFPVGDGFVVVTPEELEQVAAVQNRTIEIDRFVKLTEVDELYYAKPYLVFADKGGDRPYALLQAAMTAEKVGGVGRFVMRSRQYLVLIRPHRNMLVAQTLHWPTEVEDTSPWQGAFGEQKPNRSDLAKARQVVSGLTEPFVPELFENDVADRTRQLIEAKMKGKGVNLPTAAPTPAESKDVIDALEAMLSDKKPASRKPRARRTAKKETA